MFSTTPSLAQFISLFTTGKKLSIDRPNYTSIQVFTLRFLSRKNVEKKFVLISFFFFVTSIQFVACALREDLSNRSSEVQIPRDVCTPFCSLFVLYEVQLDNTYKKKIEDDYTLHLSFKTHIRRELKMDTLHAFLSKQEPSARRAEG